MMINFLVKMKGQEEGPKKVRICVFSGHDVRHTLSSGRKRIRKCCSLLVFNITVQVNSFQWSFTFLYGESLTRTKQ